METEKYQVLNVCPLCEQPLPHDKTEEVFNRLRETEEAAAQQERDKANEEYALKLAGAVKEARKAGEADGVKQAEKKAKQDLEETQALLSEAKEQAELEKKKREAIESSVQQKVADAVGKAVKIKVDEMEAKNFEKTQKLEGKLATVTAELNEIKAKEQGEGQDIVLLDQLRNHFPEDDIKPIKEGEPGADILHLVMHKGKECGKILYDSRSRKKWKSEFAKNLRHDQVTVSAEHAIFTTSEFPSGTSQLTTREGVIVTNKARVVTLVEILRQEMVRNFRLGLSDLEKEQKSLKLYEYITTADFKQHLEQLSKLADSLDKIEADEKIAHDKTWKKRGSTFQELRKVQADIEM